MQPTALPQLPVATVSFVLTLCGAVILALFDVWLRRRDVKDPSLLWMSVSLLSWSASAATQIVAPEWLPQTVGLRTDQIPYLLSPVSSVLLTMTAFRFSRVREAFNSSELKTWPLVIIVFVSLLSAVAFLLTFSDHALIGNTLDAVASCVALTVLGCGLTYSFHKYGNQPLAGLSAVTVTLFIARQFVGAAHGPLQGVLAAVNVATLATLTMLFIALTVAWGLSDASRSKPIGTPVNVNVVALFFDLRGSTRWSSEILNGDFGYVGDFIDKLRGWAWNQALLLRPDRPKVKFLGDGFLFVWEVPKGETPLSCAVKVVGFACTLVQDYPLWAASQRELWREVPTALGAGVDAGPAIRLTFENGSEDHIGAPLNIAATMQDLARPCGGVVVQAKLWSRFDSVQGDLFPKRGDVKCKSGEYINVRATGEVELSTQ